MKLTKTKLKSVKPRVFKFEKGQRWDGDERIFDYIENLLLECGDFPKVKQKTYITIYCAKEIKNEQQHKNS